MQSKFVIINKGTSRGLLGYVTEHTDYGISRILLSSGQTVQISDRSYIVINDEIGPRLSSVFNAVIRGMDAVGQNGVPHSSRGRHGVQSSPGMRVSQRGRTTTETDGYPSARGFKG